MAMSNGDHSDGGDGFQRTQQWEGYSDYQSVSRRVASSVEDALDAFAEIDAAYSQGAPLDATMAAEAHSLILGAAVRVKIEMEDNRDQKPVYDDILGRWSGEEGYINQFRDTALVDELPGFTFQFVEDIRRAAWHLGYLKAGRTDTEYEGDDTERAEREMFQDLT
jgi:hypothetical protein